jgi:hypothetical protein
MKTLNNDFHKSNQTSGVLKTSEVSGEENLALNTKIWMNGSLEWFAYIGDDEVFLGRRAVPAPLDEGDAWTSELGDMFKVIDGEIKLLGKTEPPKKYW